MGDDVSNDHQECDDLAGGHEKDPEGLRPDEPAQHYLRVGVAEPARLAWNIPAGSEMRKSRRCGRDEKLTRIPRLPMG